MRGEILARKIDRQTLSLGNGLARPPMRLPRTGGRTAISADCGRATNRSGPAPTKIVGSAGSIMPGDDEIADYAAFAEEIKRNGFTDAVLLGMGGSSLGPEVSAAVWAQQGGRGCTFSTPPPRRDRRARQANTLATTLFIVSANQEAHSNPTSSRIISSGWPRPSARAPDGASSPSPIPARRWKRRRQGTGFRRHFHGDPSIGGRYSVLSNFGLVPAAAMGIDLRGSFAATCVMRPPAELSPPAENPGVRARHCARRAATSTAATRLRSSPRRG